MRTGMISAAAICLIACGAASGIERTKVDERGLRSAQAVHLSDILGQSHPSGHGVRGTPAWAPFGPGGGDAQALAVSPTQSNVVVAGISNAFGAGALYRSTDSGVTWSRIPDTGSRGINDVAFASDGSGYLATDDGLFKSTDNGASWTEIILPTEPLSLVEAVTISPSNPNTLWIGLGQYFGGEQTQFVLRSDDGGASWTNISPPVGEGLGVTALEIDPADPDTIYAGFAANFGFNGELWVTEDGGVIWENRSAGLPPNIIMDLQVVAGEVFLVGGQEFGSQFIGLYSSTDAGVNWNERSAGWPSLAVNAIAIDPTNPQIMYVGTQRAGLGRSTDGGATWTFSVGGTGEFPVNDIEFTPGSGSTVFLGMGSVAVFRSTDGGTTFAPSSDGIRQLLVTAIASNPTNPNDIAIAYNGQNDGGILVTSDGGQTWAPSQAPLPRWSRLVFGPDGTLYATHDGPLTRADDGVWRREANGTWTPLGPGTPSQLDMVGRAIAVTPGPSPVIVFGGQEGFFGGYDAAVWTFNLGGSGIWEKQWEGGIPSEQIESLAILNDGAGPTVVAGIVNFGQEPGGAGGILRSPDLGDTWARSETGYPSAWHSWAVSNRPSEPLVVYSSSSENTGVTPAGTYKSVDGGVSWNFQGSHQTFRQFFADPLGDALYGVEVFSGRIYRSVDDGVSYQPFDDGIPAGSGVNQIYYGPGPQPRLFAGSSSGAFVTNLPVPCAADFNNSGSVTVQDIFDFLAAYFSNDPAADFNGVGGVSVQDIFDYLAAYFEGC